MRMTVSWPSSVVVGLVFAALTFSSAGPAAADEPSGRFEQTITMGRISDTPVQQAVTVAATATSMLPVTIAVTGTCVLQDLPGGQAIVATGPGTCTVTATQPGDDRWLPATPVTDSFAFVGNGEAGVRIALDGPETLMAAQGLPMQIPVLVVSDEASNVKPTGTITVKPGSIPGGPSCGPCQPMSDVLSDGRALITMPGEVTATLAPGAYTLTITYGGDDLFGGTSLVTSDVHIVPPGDGVPGTAPIVVSIGDSFISGEAGRWAGNAFAGDEAWRTDTGEGAYSDIAGGGESIFGCHRSASAEIHIEQAGADVVSVNLACSGAQTSTTQTEKFFTPGLDFYQDEPVGQRSQTLELYRLASANPDRIKMVVLSIGGNDFQFSTVVKTCLLQYLFSISRRECSTMPEITSIVGQANVKLQLERITDAIRNVHDAMTEAGYTDAQWTLLMQDYPSPLPGKAKDIRYSEGLGSGRQEWGGCGLFNVDMAYANNVLLATINDTVRKAGRIAGYPNIEFLDLTNAYKGNRLCEKGVDLVGVRFPVDKWTDPNALLGSEWVSPIRFQSLFKGNPYLPQENLHPNYWGQLANQVCVKLAWNNGDVRGGSCVRGDGAYDPEPGTNRVYPVMALLSDGQ